MGLELGDMWRRGYMFERPPFTPTCVGGWKMMVGGSTKTSRAFHTGRSVASMPG